MWLPPQLLQGYCGSLIWRWYYRLHEAPLERLFMNKMSKYLSVFHLDGYWSAFRFPLIDCSALTMRVAPNKPAGIYSQGQVFWESFLCIKFNVLDAFIIIPMRSHIIHHIDKMPIEVDVKLKILFMKQSFGRELARITIDSRISEQVSTDKGLL